MDGYNNEGWQSHQGSPEREFDLVWKSEKEANDCVGYLLFWMNPWVIAPHEVSDDDEDPEQTIFDGLRGWTVSPADSSQWSVSIIPAVVYAHLPNTTKRLHNHDDGREPKGYEDKCDF